MSQDTTVTPIRGTKFTKTKIIALLLVLNEIRGAIFVLTYLHQTGWLS